MDLSGSLIILAAAVGAVVCLFAGDYYYRYTDKKFSHLPLVEIPLDEEPDGQPQTRDHDHDIAA